MGDSQDSAGGPLLGFVMAAGLGTRLAPFTDERPKPLFPAGGMTFLDRNALLLKACGVTRLAVNGHEEFSAAEGEGPVDALDRALRQALNKFYPGLKDMHLTDYKVRVLDTKEGTAAKVRVLIESQDQKDSWTTVEQRGNP